MDTMLFIAVLVLITLNLIRVYSKLRKLKEENTKLQESIQLLLEEYEEDLNDPYDDYFTPELDKAIKPIKK